MTGPEHYREAERLLADVGIPPSKRARPGWLTADELVALAQVHATLALAAATAEPIAQGYDSPYDTAIPRAWSEAIS